MSELVSYYKRLIPYDKRYEIIQRIGSGNFGDVFECVEKAEPYSHYAIKKFQTKNYFETEVMYMKLMQVSNHPENFLAVFGICTFYAEQKLGAVLELFTCDLDDFIHKKTESIDLRNISQQILTAAATLHDEMGVVHCDLKATNIGLKGDGAPIVKIFDFSFAKQIGTCDNILCGTPTFAAPETIMRGGGDKNEMAKRDVWAVGLVLLELGSRSYFFEQDKLQDMHNCCLEDVVSPIEVPRRHSSCDFILPYLYYKSIFDSLTVTQQEGNRMREISVNYSDKILMNILTKIEKIAKQQFNSLQQNIKSRRNRKLHGLSIGDAKEFIELVKWLLTFDHRLRPAARQALTHELFSVRNKAEPEHLCTIL